VDLTCLQDVSVAGLNDERSPSEQRLHHIRAVQVILRWW